MEIIGEKVLGTFAVNDPGAENYHDRKQVGELAEQIERDVGDPGAHQAALVVDDGTGAGMGPARVSWMVRPQGYQDKQGNSAQGDQSRLTQALHSLTRDRKREIGFFAADRVRHVVDIVDPIDRINTCNVKESHGIS